jgi:hypothetical protein
MKLRVVVALTLLLGCSSAERQAPKPTPFDEVARDFEDGLRKFGTKHADALTKDGRIRVAASGDTFANTSPRRELSADELFASAVRAAEKAGYAVVRLPRGDTSTRRELIARGVRYKLRGGIDSVEGGTAASLVLLELVANETDSDLEIAGIQQVAVTRKLAP